MKAITGAARLVVKASTEVAHSAQGSSEEMQDIAGPMVGGPQLQQSTFNWSAKKRYTELKNFAMETKK